MDFTIIPVEHFQPKSWSGGKTTELYIFPPGSEYQKRNFQFRISTATVETEVSDFTSLPGIFRKLMILSGKITITHEGHYSRVLDKYDIDEFDGDWKTSSMGKCTDFNLMTTGKTTGHLAAAVIDKEQSLIWNFKEKCRNFVFIHSGKVSISLKNKSITLNQGDLLIINEITEKSIVIKGIENSELVFTEVK